jgi:hypothetical protein
MAHYAYILPQMRVVLACFNSGDPNITIYNQRPFQELTK